MVIGSGAAANSEDSSTYQAWVSEQTERYRELVTKYCEKYGIDDYVDLCLAMIEQESGGNPPDVMQTEQSYYNTSPPIDTAEESIDCGAHELADCLEKAKCKNPSDIAGFSLALQGYNFGNGYIDWFFLLMGIGVCASCTAVLCGKSGDGGNELIRKVHTGGIERE